MDGGDIVFEKCISLVPLDCLC